MYRQIDRHINKQKDTQIAASLRNKKKKFVIHVICLGGPTRLKRSVKLNFLQPSALPVSIVGNFFWRFPLKCLIRLLFYFDWLVH